MKKQRRFSLKHWMIAPWIAGSLLTILYVGSAKSQEIYRESLKQLFNDYLAANEISGGVILVSSPEFRIEFAAGVSDRTTRTPMTIDTRFYASSSANPMISVAILDAVSKGELKLGARVTHALRSSKTIRKIAGIETALVHQLLNHTSGLPEYFTEEFWQANLGDPKKVWESEDALNYAVGPRFSFPAGLGFSYSNTNYVILGAILSSLDGSLDIALRNRVFNRADMQSTSVGANSENKLLAHGYDSEGIDRSHIAWSTKLGDGAVVTTAADVEKFIDALFIEKNLLNKKFLSKMQKGSTSEKGYGLGIEIGQSDRKKWLGHSGGFYGYESDFRYYPDYKLKIIYMMNGNQIEDESLMEEIFDWYSSTRKAKLAVAN
jgi:D-alanyl-D-alanine carboxypeptidase